MTQEATPILHMLDPRKHVSPFDVNMAADAGFKVIVPYTNVEVQDVTPLIQDAIFTRPPNYGVRTGFFMGGAVTAWIGIDLIRLDALPGSWMAALILAGLCWLPTPLLLPRFELLALGFLLWIGWCLFVGTRRSLPSAYAEWV